MTTNSGVPYRVRWGVCAVAIGLSNAIIGAVLGLMYGLQSFGFDWVAIRVGGNGGQVWNSVMVSAVFGFVFPTALSLLLLIPRSGRSRRWPVSVAAGPMATSLLSFLFVWSFPLVLAVVGVAAIGGSLMSIGAVRLVSGVRPERVTDLGLGRLDRVSS